MELAAKRFADTVALYPAGRIDHATADSFKPSRPRWPRTWPLSRPGAIAR